MSQHPLHVVICNERLLPRFGVDRLLLLLGAGMLERGHRITFLCVRCDRQAVEAITPAMIQFTPARLDIDGAENDAALWLDRHWEQLSEISPPDLIVTGGLAVLRRRSRRDLARCADRLHRRRGGAA